MNCDIHLTDKLATYFEEVRKELAIPYVPPCINRSLASFHVVEGALVYALGALKNVGIEAMNLVVSARKLEGTCKQFSTLFDFARRVDLKRVGKRPLEMLALAGAFDVLDSNRRRVFESLDALVRYSAAIHDQKASKQVSLFGNAGDDLPEPRLPNSADWLPAERLGEEFRAVGFYLSGHPLDDYMGALRRQNVVTLDELLKKVLHGPRSAKLAGIVSGRQERKSARGNRFAFLQLSDVSGAYEVTLFSEILETAREHLEEGTKIIVTVDATLDADQLKLLGRSITPISDSLLKSSSMGLRIFIEDSTSVASVASVLEKSREQLVKVPSGPVELCLLDQALPGEVTISTGEDYPLNTQIKGALKSLEGVLQVEEILTV